LGRDVEYSIVNEFDILSREELIGIILKAQAATQESKAAILALTERVAYLEKENEALRSQLPRGGAGGVAAPPFVRPNRKGRSEQPRKKRKKSFVRRRETATEEMVHVVGDRCPDCGGPLSEPWEHDRRQVIEIPITPIGVIDHIIMAQRCGYCGKVHHAKVTDSEKVIGKHRFGIRFMSLVATLSVGNRIPHRMIQKLLAGLYGVHVSVGGISEILHKVAQLGKGETEKILQEIRGSPVVHGDETGWREDGLNGYLWSFSTPRERYFHRDKSRGHEVAKEILGEEFAAALVSDFYGGYNWYLGPKQRCWSHFKRDLDLLREKHQGDLGIERFVSSVLGVYRRGKKVARALGRRKARMRERNDLASALESRLYEIVGPYIGDKDAPQHTLAKRVERHGGEFFTFVRYEGVPSSNNAAERAIRPAVTARKISGGTRSEKGSETKSILMTLFGTWTLRKADPFQECARMLTESCSTLVPSPA